MPSLFTTLGQWKLSRGYLSAIIRGEGGDFMQPGSENGMVTGQGLTRAFKGPKHLPTLQGSLVFFNTDQSYAGLGSLPRGAIVTTSLNAGGAGYAVNDTGTVATGNGLARYKVLTVAAGVVATYSITFPGRGYSAATGVATVVGGAQPGAGAGFKVNILTVAPGGKGSVFKVQDLLLYVGAGQVAFDGAYLSGIIASSTLSLIKKSGGAYAAGALTGPFQAGHVQPGAPVIYAKSPPSAGQITMNAAVSVVIWRVSSITGQVSLMSAPSNVVTVVNGSVIVQIPGAVDTNGQDKWGFGVVKLGFADLGWYYMLPTSLHGEILETDLTTIDGHTRSYEISWANGYLLTQDTAPDKAFPPGPGEFAGAINDVAWLDANGIIYVSEPNFIGSFPPGNALFASEGAVTYLKISGNVTARLGKSTIGTLYYVGGSPALEYQVIVENQGIEFAQNAAVGANGRLLAWLGKPTVIDSNVEPDFAYSKDVTPDFEGWDSQTEYEPIVVGYDPLGKYECWFWKLKCMAKFVPEDKWCSPILFTIGAGAQEVIGNVVAAVTVRNRLYITCSDGTTLATYEFDAGTGSVMKVQTSDISRLGWFSNITQVIVEGRADNTDHPIIVEVIKNYDDDNPIADPLSLFRQTPTGVGSQLFYPRQPNVLDVNQHGIKVTITGQGGDAGVNIIKTLGSNFDLLNYQVPAGTLPQLITFAPLADHVIDDDDFLISASSSSGLIVAFAATGECTLVDHGDGTATVTLTGDVGACHITASQAGNAVYDPADNVVQDFNATLHSQVITFGAIADRFNTAANFDIAATSDSGLTVAFAASGECTLVDHGDGTATVHLTGVVGACHVTASQAGNALYSPATNVVQDFDALQGYGTLVTAGPSTAGCRAVDVNEIVGDGSRHFKRTAASGAPNTVFYSAETIITGIVRFRAPFGADLESPERGWQIALVYDNPLPTCWVVDNVSLGGLAGFSVGPGSSSSCGLFGRLPTDSTLSSAGSFTAASTDEIMMEVAGGAVKIYKNGVHKFTHPSAPTGAALHLHIWLSGNQGSEVWLKEFRKDS